MDIYDSHSTSLTAPARNALAVVPDDTAELPQVSRAVYLGSGGDLTVEMVAGAIVTFPAVPAGTMLPIRVRRVLATGTDAGDILALW